MSTVKGVERSQVSLRCLGGGLRSWLAVRWTCTAALNLTAPPILRLLRLVPGTRGDAGGSTKRPVERGSVCVERNGSEQAEVASVAEWKPPASQGPLTGSSLPRKSSGGGAPRCEGDGNRRNRGRCV